ncbi:Lactonase, 7-bladed beta-propeller-domain-containing protein [Coprinopsis sp. MPI-PUGE-AT-0042]|nr:Lactonase, 7-bladed beta-propeller-domain-containing protein [Coprinopsis sp. MPI-PUGE-AT-0042]
MVNFTILAGGFTSFIATYVLDTDTGSLTLTKQNPSGDSASWIALHPTDPTTLYAVNEVGPVGSVQSFLVDEEGGLTVVDTAPTGGNGPTYTEFLSTGEVTGLNFGSPNASFVQTDPNDPKKFIQETLATSVVSFPALEGASNPHQSLEYNGEVFIPDLGADKIWRVSKNNETGVFEVHGQIDVDKETGPRHIAIRDNLIFTLHELVSTLTVQSIPAFPNGTALPLLANVSIVPPQELLDEAKPGFTGGFFAAEIVISEPSALFPNPLIYVSNRNLGPDVDPRGDAIAIFEFPFLNATDGTNSTTSATQSGTLRPTAFSSRTSQAPAETAVESSAAVSGLLPPSLKRMWKRHVSARGHAALNMRQLPVDPVPAPSPSVPSVPAPAPVPTDTPVPDESPLKLVTHVFTGLQQIRSFAIGNTEDGSDEFLVAGANTEGGVAVFQRVDLGKHLELVVRNQDLGNRTSFVWL